jgi:hypothetical protein
MITIACVHCKNALVVVGEADEVDSLVGINSGFHPNNYVCFNCGKPATCLLSAEVSSVVSMAVLITHEVTPQEAFAALSGMGIPSEATCCAEVVEDMFLKQGIKVKGYQMPKTNRYVITSLTFPDGRVMHLGASFPGALAYRITKSHSYVEAVEAKHVD